DPEREDRQAGGRERTQQFDPIYAAPGRQGTPRQFSVAAPHRLVPDGVLDQDGQSRTDVADDVGRAALFARLDTVAVIVPCGRDEPDRPAAWPGRLAGHDGIAPDDQHTGGGRAADEFVRRQDDGVDLETGGGRGGDRQIRPAARVVPYGEGAGSLDHAGDGD